MKFSRSMGGMDSILFISSVILLIFSMVILRSISPALFPGQYIMVIVCILVFWILSKIDNEVYIAFAKYSYIVSVLALIITLIVGQVTRGTVRWLNIGPLSIQPAELVRPFIFLWIAIYFSKAKLNFAGFAKGLLLAIIPVALIVVQPSLGVGTVTGIGMATIITMSPIKKKYLLYAVGVFLLAVPIAWSLMAGYQRSRILSFMGGFSDKSGAGYNSIQSMIAVGSGQLRGRGLGQGVQTQLSFLPERQSDFIFASISEELGFAGALIVIALEGIMIFRIITMASGLNGSSSLFMTGLGVSLLVQVFAHIGMNMGLTPITGLPLPLVSAGGSSLLGTLMSLGMISSFSSNENAKLSYL